MLPGSSGLPRAIGLVVTAMLTTFASSAPAIAAFTSRALSANLLVPDSVIVGRADCGGVVWLLNEESQLVKIVPALGAVSVHQVRGLRGSDRPWGLACLADGTLWTLASPRALVRIGPDGRIHERMPLQVPWIALFGAGHRLLLEPVPPVVGHPVLGTSLPHRPLDVRPWPGLLARSATRREQLLTENFVNCGLAPGVARPCWFPESAQVTLSDGSGYQHHSFAWLHGPDVQATAPIRDVAFTPSGRVWVLATSRERHKERLVGGWLAVATGGREIARVPLNPPARLILAATDATCLLLTVRGELHEVSER